VGILIEWVVFVAERVSSEHNVRKYHLVPQLSRDADLVQGQTDDPKKTPSQYEILKFW